MRYYSKELQNERRTRRSSAVFSSVFSTENNGCFNLENVSANRKSWTERKMHLIKNEEKVNNLTNKIHLATLMICMFGLIISLV